MVSILLMGSGGPEALWSACMTGTGVLDFWCLLSDSMDCDSCRLGAVSSSP